MLNLAKKYKFLILSIVIFAALSLFGIGRNIWFDETYSMYLTRGNFGEIAEMTALDVHPPLYYWLLKIWSTIFGSSTIAFRSFSILAGIVAIIGMYHLFKRWFKEKTANFLIFFLAVNPFFLFYATETRMYALVFALMAVSTLALDQAIKTKTKKYWLIYLALIIAGLYTHYFFAVVIAVQFVYLLKHDFNKKALLIYPALVLAYLPWAPSLISQMTEVGHGFWIEPVTLETVLQFFSWSLIYFEYPLNSPFYLSLIIITLILAIATAIINRKDLKKEKNLENLGMFILFPSLILIIVSALYVPVYVPRYIIYSLALLTAFFALLAKVSLKNLLSKALIFMLLICSSFGIYNIYYHTNYDTNDMVDTIEAINHLDDETAPIVVSNHSPQYYDAIMSETERHHILIYEPGEYWGSITPIKKYNENYLENFDEFLKTADTFWLINADPEVEIKGFKIEDTILISVDDTLEAVKYVKK